MTNFTIYNSDSTEIHINSDIQIQNILKFSTHKNQLFLLSTNFMLFTGFIEKNNSIQLKLIKICIIDIECWNDICFIVNDNGYVFKININSINNDDDNDNEWQEIIIPTIKFCPHGYKSITEKVRISKINVNNDGILFTSFNKELYGMGNFSDVLQSENIPIKVECFSGLKILQVSMGDDFSIILTCKKTEQFDDYYYDETILNNDILYSSTDCNKCTPHQQQQQHTNNLQNNNLNTNNNNNNINNNCNKTINNLSKSTTETSMASSPSDTFNSSADDMQIKNNFTKINNDIMTTTTTSTLINNTTTQSSSSTTTIKSSKDTAINFFLESLSISSEDFIEAGKQTKILKDNVTNITKEIYEGVKTLSRHMSGSDNGTPPLNEPFEMIGQTTSDGICSSGKTNNCEFNDCVMSLSETSSIDIENDYELQTEYGIETKLNRLCRFGNCLITTGVWSFGSVNREGELGTGDQVKRNRIIPVLKLQSQGVMKIECGRNHTSALTLDGRMYLWGSNLLKQISHELFDEFTAPKMYKNKERILDICIGENYSMALFNDLTIIEESNKEKFKEKLNTFEIREGGDCVGNLTNDGLEGSTGLLTKIINCNIFHTSGDYLLINQLYFSPIFNHLTSEEKFLFEILNTYNTIVKPFLKKTFQIQQYGQLYDNLCHLYFNIINLTALNVYTLREYYIKHINCYDLIIIKNTNEMISLYRNYLKVFTNIGCCKLSFEHINYLLDKPTTFNIRKIFENPFRRIWSYSDLISDLLRHENETNKILLEEKKRIWDKFRIEKDLQLDDMERTIKFWKNADKNLINELQEPERRLILDSKDIQLKLTTTIGPFQTQRFILFTDYLCCYTNQLVKYQLQTLWIESLPDIDMKKNISNALKILTPEINLILTTKTHEDKIKWLDEISKCIKLSLNKPITSKVPACRNTSYEFGNKHPIFPGVKYFGMFSNGNLHGIGRLEFPDGKVYNGLVTSSEIHGYGQMFTPHQGGNYEGNFENGKYHGYGVLEMKNKEKYKGNFRAGEFNGHGKLENDRFTYVGEFMKNMKHGYGILDDMLNGDKYLGMFENNKKNGLGILVNIHGDYFNGLFIDDNLIGDGFALLIDGSYYRGELLLNGPNGKGQLFVPIIKTENIFFLDEYKRIVIDGRCITGSFYGTWRNIKISNGLFGMDIVQSEEIDPRNIGPNKKWCSLFKDWETEVFGDSTRSWHNNWIWNKISVYISNSKRKEKLKSDGFEMKNQLKIPLIKKNNNHNNYDTISMKSSQSSISSQYSKRSTLDIRDKLLLLPDIINKKSLSNDKIYVHHNNHDDDDDDYDNRKKCDIYLSQENIIIDGNLSDNYKRGRRSKESILESTPNFGAKELTKEEFILIKEYLYEAFKNLNHPLGVLISKISKCFYFSYGHWNNIKPTILRSQAIAELESISKRIYDIVRKLFPALPEERCIIDDETISHRSLYFILLSNSIYSSLFVLYASKSRQLDELCQQRINYCDKKTDDELMKLLKIDINLLKLIKNNYYTEAIKIFRRVETKYCPMEMLEQIKRTFNFIKLAANETMGDKFQLNADELIPLTIFLILRANIPHLGAEILLLEDLLESESDLNGEVGVCFTHIKASYSHIVSSRFFDELFT